MLAVPPSGCAFQKLTRSGSLSLAHSGLNSGTPPACKTAARRAAWTLARGGAKRHPWKMPHTTHPGRDASSVSLSLATTTGVMSVAGTPSGVQTRLLGTRGVARASLNPGLMAEIPSGCEKTKSDGNLKLSYLNAIRVRAVI
jgi:hypothetical protein